MEFTALIVDDEADGRSVMKKLLNKFVPQALVVGEADSAETAYGLILSLKPQVVFLDIQMPKANGFELLKKFSTIPFEIVFVTSYDKYAIEAIRFSALDYLLKPVEVTELQKAIERLGRALMKKQVLEQQVVNVIAHLEDKGVEKKIVVHHNEAVKLLPLGAITHLEGDSNYTIVHTTGKNKFHSSKTLLEFEEMLAGYPQFLRIGKSCIVNVNHISSYSKGETCMLTIDNFHTFEVSRRKKQEVLARIKDH